MQSTDLENPLEHDYRSLCVCVCAHVLYVHLQTFKVIINTTKSLYDRVTRGTKNTIRKQPFSLVTSFHNNKSYKI